MHFCKMFELVETPCLPAFKLQYCYKQQVTFYTNKVDQKQVVIAKFFTNISTRQNFAQQYLSSSMPLCIRYTVH